MANIYLITQGLIEKSDSIGYDLAFQYRLFKQWGFSVRVFTGQHRQNLYADIPIENIDRLAIVMKEQPALIIYHWVDGWKEIDEWLATLSTPVIIRWHNNTPPWFFAPYSVEATSRTIRGFQSILRVAESNSSIKFWVNSEFTKHQLEILGVSSNRIQVTYPASHYIEYENKLYKDSPEIVTKIKHDDNIRLLFVGRITPHKGYHHVILATYALQKLLEKKVDVYFPGRPDNSMSEYLRYIRSLSDDLKLSVHFLGEVELDELHKLYRTSHAFIALSEHEGFGLPILEAMRMKLPVVGYKSTAVANLLANHPLACDKLDYFEIAKKLAVAVQPDIRTAIIKLQTEMILPHFSRKIIENQLSVAIGREESWKENITDDHESLEIINNALRRWENVSIPIMSLPFSCKDYPNHYVTRYDILAYDTLLRGQEKNPEETDLWDEAMRITFSSHRRLLGPWIIFLKKIVLGLQDGMIRTIAKSNARLDKKMLELDKKLDRLIKEDKYNKYAVTEDGEDKMIDVLSSMYDENYFEGKKTKSNYQSYSKDAKIPGEILADTLLELFQPRSSLDVGCALGFVVKEMHKHDVKACGIDISEWAVKQADVPYISQLDISRQKIIGEYDVVTAFDILEHIPEQLLPYAVQNLWRATRRYLIVVPAYYEEGTSYDPGDALHVVFHPKSWWEDLFKSCGMSIDMEIAEKLSQTEYAKTYGYAGRFIVGVRK
jgi:glycosyltransferase involved in cell wall biosynthesis/SAM-dependent methyltransferase